MIDLAKEQILTLGQASRESPGQPHISTINRWHLRGVSGVRLETVVIGGRRYTSRQALDRFAVRTTQARDGTGVNVAISDRRESAIEREEQELNEALSNKT